MKHKILMIILFVVAACYAQGSQQGTILTNYNWRLVYQDSCDENEWKFLANIKFKTSDCKGIGYITDRKGKTKIGWYSVDGDQLFIDFFSLISIYIDVTGIELNKPAFVGTGIMPGGCIEREAMKECSFILIRTNKIKRHI